MQGPPAQDICYATENRQLAVKAIAPRIDLLLVVGSQNSSNSRRMVEVCLNQGVAAHLVDDERELNPGWFEGVGIVGVTAGASAPEHLVQSLIEHVQNRYGFGSVEEVEIKDEDVKFSLPGELTRGLTQISNPPPPM